MQNSDRTVLVFSYYFPPLGMGGVQRISKFVKYLPHFQQHPSVVTVKPIRYYAADPSLSKEIAHCPVYHAGSLDPNRIAHLFSHWSRPSAAKTDRPSRVQRACSALMRRIAIPDTKIGWVPFAVAKGAHLLKNGGFSTILTTSPPLSAHVPGLILAKRLHIPWVADFRDHWLSEPRFHEKAGIHSAARRLLAAKTVAGADAVTAVSDPILTELKSLADDGDTRFLTIPNGFDPDDFHNVSPIRHETFTITYCGTLSSTLHPGPLFTAVADAVQRRADLDGKVSIRLVGKATDIDVKSLVKEKGADAYTLLRGYVSHTEAVSEMMSADLLVFLLPDTCSSGMVTGKLYEYLASGRPILAFSGECEAARILQNHQECCIVTSEHTEKAADFILKRYDEWRRSAMSGHPSVTFPALHRYDRREHARMLANLLRDIS